MVTVCAMANEEVPSTAAGLNLHNRQSKSIVWPTRLVNCIFPSFAEVRPFITLPEFTRKGDGTSATKRKWLYRRPGHSI